MNVVQEPLGVDRQSCVRSNHPKLGYLKAERRPVNIAELLTSLGPIISHHRPRIKSGIDKTQQATRLIMT